MPLVAKVIATLDIDDVLHDHDLSPRSALKSSEYHALADRTRAMKTAERGVERLVAEAARACRKRASSTATLSRILLGIQSYGHSGAI
jgi:hypothetical protein